MLYPSIKSPIFVIFSEDKNFEIYFRFDLNVKPNSQILEFKKVGGTRVTLGTPHFKRLWFLDLEASKLFENSLKSKRIVYEIRLNLCNEIIPR